MGILAISLHEAASAAFAGAGGLFAASAGYLAVLAAAALLHRGCGEQRDAGRMPSPRLIVLIPAHDEADFILRCVESLADQSYPADLFEIVVIADNCTDRTAEIAAGAGVRVLVRHDEDLRGKGQALRWAIDQLLEGSEAPDGIVIVDADSVADHRFLTTLAGPMELGADAVQGESLMCEDDSPRAALRAAAFLLMNRVRPAGRQALHLPCNLAGNGMLLSRRLLLAHPWNAFSSCEDLEYSIRLRLEGVRPAFAKGAVLSSPVVSDPKAAEQQRLRWEGGKLHIARSWIPRLVLRGVRTRRISMLDAALDLAVPPLGLLAAGIAFGVLLGLPLVLADVIDPWALAPWLLACATVPLYVLLGLKAAHAPSSAYRAMLRAPAFVCAKAFRAHRLLGFRADSWVRAERPSEAAARINAQTSAAE